jgi:hypothetical protein
MMRLASGNFAGIARRKLTLAGMAKYFPDKIDGLVRFIERNVVLLAGRKQAEELKEIKFEIVTHIGDTPRGVNVALQVGAVQIGVRTGRVSYPEYPELDLVFANIVEAKDSSGRCLNSPKP